MTNPPSDSRQAPPADLPGERRALREKILGLRMIYVLDAWIAIAKRADDGVADVSIHLAFIEAMREAALLASSPAPAVIPQVDLPADAAKVLREHAWDLYDGTAAPAAPLYADCPKCGRHVQTMTILKYHRHGIAWCLGGGEVAALLLDTAAREGQERKEPKEQDLSRGERS